MVKYVCEICGKVSTQKSRHEEQILKLYHKKIKLIILF